MKTAILTAGPQGAGKSTYCKKVIRENPSVALLSRDEILIEIFGSTHLDSYSGGHIYVMEELFKRLQNIFQSNDSNATVIVDCWNGFPSERHSLANKLRAMGVDNLEAWYFVTPIDACISWFVQREYSEPKHTEWDRSVGRRRCISDYRLFHEMAADLIQGDDTFDRIRRINPLQLILPGMPLLT